MRFLTSHLLLVLLAPCAIAQVEPLALLPTAADCTQMWWAEGFPAHTPTAPWLRVIQTGRYAMALNTETLRVEHFGAVGSLEDDYRKLPSAELTLNISVDGKLHRCSAGGKWSRYTGPRFIASGRFFQRGDVTDLQFKAEDGSRLNVDARLETAGWSDRLALILAARPGVQAITAGEASFGRVGGGFGLDGANQFEVPHRAELDAEIFTLELWAFVPANYQASERVAPWLVCKNHNETVEGNYGLMITNGQLQARINIGGGSSNAMTLTAAQHQGIKIDAWNHLAMSYDGEMLRLYLNGAWAGEQKIGRARVPGHDGLALGRRQDNSGDGYHFRGVIDEVRCYDRALELQELQLHWNKPEAPAAGLKPVAEWTFNKTGAASMTRPRESWQAATMEIKFASLQQQWQLPKDQAWPLGKWREVALALDPVACKTLETQSAVTVLATEFTNQKACPVNYDASLGWHRINLDEIEPIAPPGGKNPSNDAIERIKLVLANPSDREQVARLMFEKTHHGFHQRIGTPITGISAILRDSNGYPTGIPVQLSKNWHTDSEGGVYAGQWWHGISQVRLPAQAKIELELTIAYGHWGGVPAASHAQLSLIGWGSNQLWDQSALGAWGESICYEPDQAQANCSITDVRPAMVKSTAADKPWTWTGNVGGGDCFRFFNPDGKRVPPTAMRTTYAKQGPCLTEVTYAGRIGASLTHSITASLARSDDLVRATYRVRLDVSAPTDFSRFVIFQVGADTYDATVVGKMAMGNEGGLIREWHPQAGGNIYRTEPLECTGRIPWISLHEATTNVAKNANAIANRGIIIRSWNAKLGGRPAAPWMAERGLTRDKEDSSTLDLVPPPGVTHFQSGDFIDATLELILMPQSAAAYYGPNEGLRTALSTDANTYRMIQREANGNDRRIVMKTGNLVRTHPAITVRTVNDQAEFKLTGGLAYVPITFTGLSSPRAHSLLMDGKILNQSIHGNDFWQTDYDPTARQWSVTYNVPINDQHPHSIQLTRSH